MDRAISHTLGNKLHHRRSQVFQMGGNMHDGGMLRISYMFVPPPVNFFAFSTAVVR